MEYILNKTYVKTTNGFKMNDIKVDLDILPIKSSNLLISGIDYKSVVKSNFDSNIGLKSSEYNSTSIDVIGNKKIYVNCEFDSEYFISNELNINLENNSKSDIFILFTGSKGINNFKIIVSASKNCTSNISVINLSRVDSFISIENKQSDNSNIIFNFTDLGGNLRVSNYYCELLGIKAINYLNTIYMGKSNDRIDCNYYIKCIGENTNAYINSYGVLDDNSYKTYKGTIDFVTGSRKSIGEEIEKCILLSNTCKSRSLPILLCGEEDVIGNHGVSTGKLDNSQLFYLMSKGIEEIEAKKLIIMGNFNKIIENIDDEKIKQKIIDKISDNLI